MSSCRCTACQTYKKIPKARKKDSTFSFGPWVYIIWREASWPHSFHLAQMCQGLTVDCYGIRTDNGTEQKVVAEMLDEKHQRCCKQCHGADGSRLILARNQRTEHGINGIQSCTHEHDAPDFLATGHLYQYGSRDQQHQQEFLHSFEQKPSAVSAPTAACYIAFPFIHQEEEYERKHTVEDQ